MGHLRSPASGAVCRRQAAQTGIGGRFRLCGRFCSTAANPLTCAASRARPDAGREIRTNPKISKRPRCRRSAFRAFAVAPRISCRICYRPPILRAPYLATSPPSRQFTDTQNTAWARRSQNGCPRCAVSIQRYIISPRKPAEMHEPYTRSHREWFHRRSAMPSDG